MKISTVITAAIITCSLAVCASASDDVTAEKLYDAWQDKMAAAESISLSEKMDMGIGISLLGQNMAIDMLFDIDMQSAGDNTHFNGDVHLKAASPDGEENEDIPLEMYAVPAADGSGYTIYENNGEGWKYTTEEGRGKNMDPQSLMVMDNISLSDGTITISINDTVYECYELTGTVPFSNMNNTLQMAGGDASETLGAAGLNDLDGNIPAKMYFDTETEDLIKVEIEGADVLGDLVTQRIKEDSSVPPIPGLFKIDIPAFIIEIDSISLNTVDEITVPDEVISSAEEVDSLAPAS